MRAGCEHAGHPQHEGAESAPEADPPQQIASLLSMSSRWGPSPKVSESASTVYTSHFGGAGDPHLVLSCEATRGVHLFLGEEAGSSEAGDLGVHGVGGFNLHAEVVDRAASAGILQQHQFEGRLRDREVGVTRLDFAGAELNKVERTRLLRLGRRH